MGHFTPIAEITCPYDRMPDKCLVREEPLMIWGGGARAKAGKKKLKKNSTASCRGKKKLNANSLPEAPPRSLMVRP